MALRGRNQGLPKIFKYPLLSQELMVKATDFKFGRYIHRVHLNKSPKNLEKRVRGRIQGLSKVF